MGDFVTALGTDVTAATLWGALTPAAALVGVGIIVGFGYMVLRRTVGGLGRGKAKV